MNTPGKILVLRFSSIGDIILSSPLLRVLRKRFPQSQIDYATRKDYAELIRSNQNINYTYELDTDEGIRGLWALRKRIRDEGYDLIVDIHGSIRSLFITACPGASRIVRVDKRKRERVTLVRHKKDVYDRIVPVSQRYIETVLEFGVTDDGKGTEIQLPDSVLSGASGKLARLKLNEYERVIGLCPTARHLTKRWPKDRFVGLGAKFVKEWNAKILIFGGPADFDYCRTVADSIEADAGKGCTSNLCGTLDLLETAATMDFCDLVVTNDSGLMHMAEARGRNLAAIFGSTVRQFGFFPQNTNSGVIERTGLYCRPCTFIGRDSCPEKHFRCMKEIEVQDVFRECGRLVQMAE